MRLAQGPLGRGRARLLGILLAEVPPRGQDRAHCSKDTSQHSPAPARLSWQEMSSKGKGKKDTVWCKSAFCSESITADAASLEGKGKCKGSWKTRSQRLGNRFSFVFSIYLGRFGIAGGKNPLCQQPWTTSSAPLRPSFATAPESPQPQNQLL